MRGVGRKTVDILAGELADRGLHFLDEAKSLHLTNVADRIADVMAQNITVATRAAMNRSIETELRKMAKSGVDLSELSFDDLTEPMALIGRLRGREVFRFTVSVRLKRA